MRMTVCVTLALALVGGCSPRHDRAPRASKVRADTLSERQRDSIIGASRLPGAKAVDRALDASDAAAAHTAAVDSARAELER